MDKQYSYTYYRRGVKKSQVCSTLPEAIEWARIALHSGEAWPVSIEGAGIDWRYEGVPWEGCTWVSHGAVAVSEDLTAPTDEDLTQEGGK